MDKRRNDMSQELKETLVSLIDGLKSEIEEINEDIARLSLRAENTKKVKELNAINEELEDLDEELREDLQELKSLIKRYKKLSK